MTPYQTFDEKLHSSIVQKIPSRGELPNSFPRNENCSPGSYSTKELLLMILELQLGLTTLTVEHKQLQFYIIPKILEQEKSLRELKKFFVEKSAKISFNKCV